MDDNSRTDPEGLMESSPLQHKPSGQQKSSGPCLNKAMITHFPGNYASIVLSKDQLVQVIY